MKIITLDETDSTNSYMQAHACEMEHGDTVCARHQTSGRGQRGNSWESAPEMNVTMSMFLRPENLNAAKAFPLSEAVAVGVVDTLSKLLPAEMSDDITVKWPNDIYVGDKKIAGILIENSLRGAMVRHSIIGVGLNLNQREFLSDAPNPVSVFQLTGKVWDVATVTEALVAGILASLHQMESDSAALHQLYMSRLWRGKGVYPFVCAATGRCFEASVVGVATSGHITLCEHPSGQLTEYAFKEIVWS